MGIHWLFENKTAMPHCHKAIVMAGFEEENIFKSWLPERSLRNMCFLCIELLFDMQ